MNITIYAQSMNRCVGKQFPEKSNKYIMDPYVGRFHGANRTPLLLDTHMQPLSGKLSDLVVNNLCRCLIRLITRNKIVPREPIGRENSRIESAQPDNRNTTNSWLHQHPPVSRQRLVQVVEEGVHP
jgi:hypothetical protein